MREAGPVVSVVIPAYNATATLERCLRAVQAQTYPADRREVILVDNGSTDRTREIAAAFGAQVLERPGVSISAVRNAGVAAARGSIIAFLDSDCVAIPTWIEAAIARLQLTRCAVGAKYELPDDPTWIERAWYSQRSADVREVSFLSGGNFVLPVDAFRQVGGFDESLTTGEDYELCVRLKRASLPIVSDPSVAVMHLGNPRTLKQFYKREVWYGLGALGNLKESLFDKPLLGTIAFVGLVLGAVAGALLAATGRRWDIFVASMAGLTALLAATLWARREFVQRWTQAGQLMVLYLAFYAGRSVALMYLAAGLRPRVSGRKGS